MMITYGHQVTSMDDKFVRMAELVREYAEKTTGNSVVDLFPIRRSLVLVRISYHSVFSQSSTFRLGFPALVSMSMAA